MNTLRSSSAAIQLALISDPNHWRSRAAAARAIAEDIADAGARHTMQEIARGYDRLAVHAEASLITRLPVPPCHTPEFYEGEGQ
jgi:hypothetical protein